MQVLVVRECMSADVKAKAMTPQCGGSVVQGCYL